MGNISSRQAAYHIDGFVLRLARTVDSVFRTINRKLSTISSFFFSRVFGYDVVFTDDSASPLPAQYAANGREPLMCQGNVCIVPASRIQQRQMEKKRRSERRKRAEAAALGQGLLRKHSSRAEGAERAEKDKGGYSKVHSVPSSPTVEKQGEHLSVMESLGPVPKAPAARPLEERETAAERERGKLWVMGNIQPRINLPPSIQTQTHTTATLQQQTGETSPSSPLGDKTIDERVLQRMNDQRATANATIIVKNKLQPRRSSKRPASSVPSYPSPTPLAASASMGINSKAADPVVEKDDMCVEATDFSYNHLTTRKDRPLHAPTAVRLPPGALSLGPSPWEATTSFRHPFSNDHEVLLTSKAKHQLRQFGQRPNLTLDTHLESSPLPHGAAAFVVGSPLSLDDAESSHDSTSIFPLLPPSSSTARNGANPGFGIPRPPSTASNRARTPAALARRSIDAMSLRSVDSASAAGMASGGGERVIDVKTLATKAVKEEKGRKVWKDEVNKFAMQRCLAQQQFGGGAGGGGGGCEPGRRLSTATLNAANDKILTRVRTQEDGQLALSGGGVGLRRGSSPALNLGMPSGRSTPGLRAESPLHAVMR